MAAYSLYADDNNNITPKLLRGPVRISTAVAIYWVVGPEPVINPTNCALLEANESKEIYIPVNCARIAVMAVDEPGAVTIIENFGGAKASCSA